MAAFPSITPSSISLVSVNPTRIATTLNGIEQRASGTGQYYRITAEYSNLTQAQVRQIMGHMAGESGPLNSFTFALPTYLGTITGSGASMGATGSNSIGQSGVSLTVGSGTTPYFKAGDLLKFTNHNKVYQVTADATTASVSFKPPLRAAVPNGTGITTTSLSMTVRYATDNQEFSINTDLFSSFSIEFIEVLS
jgi:hypothetical protein